MALRSLWLSSNSVHDAGAQALATALETNVELRSLALWHNGISCGGVRSFERALRSNTVLSQLFLGANEGADAAEPMARLEAAVARNAERQRAALTGAELGSVPRDEL